MTDRCISCEHFHPIMRTGDLRANGDMQVDDEGPCRLRPEDAPWVESFDHCDLHQRKNPQVTA
jgi:hypothetical protein